MAHLTISGGKGGVLLNAVTSAQTGAAIETNIGPKVCKATLTGTGVVSATVNIYGNTLNTNSGGILCATLNPSGTTTAVDGVAMDAPWPFMYADLAFINGTNATISVAIGV
jgi:hypothetical protein